MGNFSSIKDAIFGSEAQAQEAPPATSTPGSGGFSRADTKGEAISEVDVEAKLDSMPGADKLNWRTSIVDLMKLVGLDPSYANRKELAQLRKGEPWKALSFWTTTARGWRRSFATASRGP